MPTKSYAITPDKLASLKSEVVAGGGTVTGTDTSGTLTPPSHPEITLGYAVAGNELQLTILHSSWYESSGAIWDGLAKYLA